MVNVCPGQTQPATAAHSLQKSVCPSDYSATTNPLDILMSKKKKKIFSLYFLSCRMWMKHDVSSVELEMTDYLWDSHASTKMHFLLIC